MEYLEFKERADRCINTHNIKSCRTLLESLDEIEKANKKVVSFSVILKIAELEEMAGIKGVFWKDEFPDMDSLVGLYYKVKYTLRRIEYGVGYVDGNEFLKLNFSKQMLLMMTSLFTVDKIKVVGYLQELYRQAGNLDMEQVLKKFYNL